MSNQTQNPQNQNRNNDYVDLVTTGIGYINRPRWITPDKGEPYMGCSITAWYGKGGKDTQLFETSVFGQAKDVLNALLQAYPQVTDRNAGPKVTVTCGFTIGDGTPDSFTTRKGEYVKCIRGRLFKISWVNVNGQRFFTHQDDTDQQNQSQQYEQPPVQQGGYQQPVQSRQYANHGY